MNAKTRDALEGRDFTIAPGVSRAAHGIPYERTPEDPRHRRLSIFSLDPAASRLDGAIAEVKVPYEPLAPGPVGALFEVDDVDDAQGTHWGHADLEDRSVLLRNGYSPSTTNPLFHQQMVYAVCSTVYQNFREALGRQVSWDFALPPGQERDRACLRILPHAFEDRNAFYDRSTGELRFGYFRAVDDPDGRTPPGGVVFTCLSHDIVAHEVTHALLDGLRSHFCHPVGSDVLGFHEGFADLVAIFQHFSYRDMVRVAVRRSEGRLESATLLTGIAHQFSQSLGSTQPLRTAFEHMADGNNAPKRYDSADEAHAVGEVLVQAVFAAWMTVFNRKVERYIRLASGGTGRLPPGQVPADLQDILAEEASALAGQFLTICIRAIDYCPPVDMSLGEYLRALITADHDLVPDDPWGYREALIDAFRVRGIYPPKVTSLSEDSLRWRRPELSVASIPDLSFGKLQFAGDPAAPASPDELRRQARALGAFVARPEQLAHFGLARSDDPALGDDILHLPCVQSIRSSRRVGPDGQVVFDLVAEVTQRRTVVDPRGTFDAYGGGTVILGPKGEFRYVIAKSILSADRIDRQRDFIHGMGKRYWELRGHSLHPTPNVLKLLHAPRAP
jgi:hypothetical protein